MKTIVARFTEMKKAPTDVINVEGEEISVNKVEAALKSVGVELRNTTGEFRELDDVFLELASKWDSLDVMSQRYVATMAAGSRQQSRFIAMMSNYQRTMELMGYATNSAGASQKQFEKTMDSLESKLNRLHDAWEQYVTGIANQSIIKGVVDLLTSLLETVNKITDALDPFHTGWSKILVAFLGFKAAKGVVNNVLKGIGTQLAVGFGRNGEEAGEKYSKSFIQSLKKNLKIQDVAKVAEHKQNANKYSNLAEKERERATISSEKYQKAINDEKIATDKLIAAKKDLVATEKKLARAKKESQAQQQAGVPNYSLPGEGIEDLEQRVNSQKDVVKKRENAVDTAHLATQEAEFAATIQNANADKLEEKATEEKIAAKKAEQANENIGLLTKAKYYAMMLFGTKTTREKARASLADAGSKFAQAGATNTATGAQWALNAAMMACPVGWILAAIAAIVAAIAIFAAVHETTAEKVERLSKTVEELGAQMNETQETINDLKSSWESLQGLEDELNNLTEGTVEWKQKLVEVNQEVLNLIDKYPKLAQYVSNDNGQLKISSSGYDAFLNEQLESLQMQQQSFAFGQSLLADMQKQELSEKNTSTFKQSQIKKQQMDSKEIERDNYFASGISNLASNYIEEQEKIGNKLTEEEKDLLATVSANKQSLKNFEKIKKETDADVDEYARLTGLTKEQVEAKKEQGELNNDAIQTLIATNKYQEKYKEQAENLVRLTKTTKLKDVEKRAISGANSFTSNDLGNNNVQEIFSKYLKDGIATIEEDDFDNIREILTTNFGFTPETLRSLEECGVSLESIVQNLVDSESSLDHYEENLKQLGYVNNRILTDFINNIQDNLGKELSTEQLKQVSDLFVDIKSQGGDIQGFSDSLKEIISSIKNPKDLEQFLNILKNVDFSSETAIRTFSDELSTLGVNLGENVTTQLAKASNAAEDFDLSQLTSQLRNFELADKVKAKREGSDKAFNETDYKAITQDLQKKGEQELIDQFPRRGSNYVFTGDWDKLINALQGDLTFVEKKKQRQKTQEEYENKQKEYVKLLENSKATDYAPEEKNRETIWDYDKEWNYSHGNESSYTFDFKNPGELESDYLNSLLYIYNDDGQIQTDPYGDSGEGAFDWNKISDILSKATTDSDFAKAIPDEFYTKVIERIDANYTDDWDSSTVIYDSLLALKKLVGYEGMDFSSEDFHNKINDYTKSTEGWENAQLEANVEYLQPYLDKGLITQDEFDEMSKKTREEIQTWIQSLDFSELYNKLHDETVEEEKGQYIGIDSAQKIIEKTATTTEGFEAQKETIDAIVHSCDGYKERLKDIQKQYNINEEAAKQVLAVEIERENATKEIASVLSSNEKILDKDNLDYSKNTGEYYAAMDALVKKFKVLFGDNITQEWVEKNLETIKKLSKGGKEAQDAMDALSATAEASKATIFQANSGKAGGEKSKTVFDAIRTNINKATRDIKSKTSEVEGYFASIKKELDNLDGSDATIEVKENTRAAVMEELKNSIYALIAQKVITKDTSEKNAIQSKINLIKSLASDIGFAISVPDDSNVSADNEFATWKSRGLTDKQAEIQAQKSIDSQLEELKKGITVIDTQGTTVELNNPYGGNGDGKEDKDSSSKKEWTNDYDEQYNILQKIEGLERKRTQLEKEYNKLLKQRYLDEKKLNQQKKQQIEVLQRQADINNQLMNDSLANMLANGNGDVWFDPEAGILQTNPNAINYNEEQMKVYNKQLTFMQKWYSTWKSSQDNLEDIYDAIDELTEVAEFSLEDLTDSIDRAIEVLDNTLTNLEREISRLDRYDSGATSSDYKKRYEQSAQTYADKYNQLTNKKAINEQKLNSQMYSDYGKYINVDWNAKEVTKSAEYYAITDPDVKDKVDEFVSEAQEIASNIIDMDNQQEEIRDSLYELQQTLADKSLEFQEKVYDAVIKSREDEITTLNTINDSIRDAASELISSIQKNIQKIRQERSNKKTEEELSKMQSRLDFLRMDTSSGNQKAILDLEKQLENKEESYTDALIDQKISELQDQNTEAEKQRKRQIEIMETQLELSKENGAIWKAVDDAIKTGFNSSGRIQKGSDLYNMLSSLDEVTKKNSVQFERWFGELNNLAAAYNANLTANLDTSGQMSNTVANANDVYGENSEYIKSLKSRLEAMNRDGNFNDLMWYDQERQEMVYKYSHYYASSQTEADDYNKKVAEYQALARELANARAFYKINKNASFVSAFKRLDGYDSGGLADYTGFAWLDGTPTSPEMVLSSKDTENFIQLKDILSNVMNGEVNKNNGTNGDYYFEIAINVDKVTSDYDVDQIADRIKQQISDSARYRNVNVINLLR